MSDEPSRVSSDTPHQWKWRQPMDYENATNPGGYGLASGLMSGRAAINQRDADPTPTVGPVTTGTALPGLHWAYLTSVNSNRQHRRRGDRRIADTRRHHESTARQ